MSDIEPLLAAIEDDPTEAFRWSILADWLEERGEPLSDLVREAAEGQNWGKTFDQAARLLSLHRMQLVACDAVEPLLENFEDSFPRNRAARRLLEGVRLGQSIGEIWSLHRDLSDLSEIARVPRRPNSLAGWLVQAAAESLAHLIGSPRRASFRAAVALAHKRTDIVPTRSSAMNSPGPLRDAIEIEFRRLVIQSIRHDLEPPRR